MKKMILAFFVVFLLVGCAPSENKIEVSQAVVRLSGNDTPAAGYMTIKNGTSKNDRLVGITADFAGQVMLHQSSVNAAGVASMQMVGFIDLPAGGQAEFKPGGYHLMLTALNPDVKVGDTVTLVLQFEQAGAINVSALVTK